MWSLKILRTDVVFKAQVRSPRKEHEEERGEIPGPDLEGLKIQPLGGVHVRTSAPGRRAAK